jgi:hypothetical protein
VHDRRRRLVERQVVVEQGGVAILVLGIRLDRPYGGIPGLDVRVRTLLEPDSEHVEAILVANSMMAVGVLQVLRERGLTPGLDVEVVVFDDAPWTGLLTPAISVIHQPAYELGQVAGKLLLDRLRSPGQPARTVMLNATLPPAGEMSVHRGRRSGAASGILAGPARTA